MQTKLFIFHIEPKSFMDLPEFLAKGVRHLRERIHGYRASSQAARENPFYTLVDGAPVYRDLRIYDDARNVMAQMTNPPFDDGPHRPP